MEQLIQSSDLFVMQVEMDVYTALKKVASFHLAPLGWMGDGLLIYLRHFLLFPSSLFLSIKMFSSVDVSADESLLGRSHQAAFG